MKPTTPNARFWHSHRGHWVKLTVHPEKPITVHFSERGDEGPHWESDTYEIEENNVVCNYASGGSDCDGSYRSGGTVVCPMDKLKSRDYDGILLPTWKKQESWQRDYSAEAAGY